MRSRKWPWRLFLGFIGVIVLGYTGVTLNKFYRYATLTEQTPVESIRWSIYSHDQEAFAPQADYTFTVDGQGYSNKIIWNEGDYYFNPWALEKPLAQLANQEWKVWFNPKNPTYSALQKNFPVKECLSTVIIWMLLIYFIMLGKYAERKRGAHGDNHSGKLHKRRRAAASNLSSGKRDEFD